MKKILSFIAFLFIATSCVSTQSTLKNIDDNSPAPMLLNNNTFAITVFSKDKRYGYEKDYPINVFFGNTSSETNNEYRFLNALAGPNGEKINYKKLESCCPFPTKRSEMGAGLLSVYEIRWEGQKNPVTLYLNIYEKGILMIPAGFTQKKI
jgi:hypothetical protein